MQSNICVQFKNQSIVASLVFLIAGVYSLNHAYADPKIKNVNNDPFAVAAQVQNHNVSGDNGQNDSETIPNEEKNVIMCTS
jgi:hypothetical protein